MYDRMFESYIEKLERFRFRYNEMEKYAKSHVKNSQYGRGGLDLHRGPLCPSPIFDIVIGRCNRGKLLTKAPKSSPDYIYHFDKENRLIAVEKAGMSDFVYEKEFVEYSDCGKDGVISESMVFSTSKNLPPHPSLFCRCEYSDSGKITKYITASANTNTRFAELHQERYVYDSNNLLQSAIMEDIMTADIAKFDFVVEMFPDGYIQTVDYFLFDHNDEGRLVSYRQMCSKVKEEIDAKTIIEKGHLYTVPKTKWRHI